jgi:hypothetical protein
MHLQNTEVHSDVRSSGTHDLGEGNMRQNRIQSKNAKSFLQLLIGIRMVGVSPLVAVALGMAAFWFPETVHAQEYSWCLVSGQHQASAAAL